MLRVRARVRVHPRVRVLRVRVRVRVHPRVRVLRVRARVEDRLCMLDEG